MGMPVIALKDSRTKMILGKAATNKCIADYADGVLKKSIERPGHTKEICESDYEPTILALQEAARRE